MGLGRQAGQAGKGLVGLWTLAGGGWGDVAVGDVISFRVRHNMPLGHLHPGLTSRAIAGMFTPLQGMGGSSVAPVCSPHSPSTVLTRGERG